MTVRGLLKEASEYLKSKNIEDPTRESGLLLSWAMGKDLSFLYAHPDLEPDKIVIEVFKSILKRRGDNEPLSYITGECEFLGLSFKVNKNVLIPRADTEILAEAALYSMGKRNFIFNYSMFTLPNKDSYLVLDACTGSGCLAVSIARYENRAYVEAVDISEEAIKLAKLNAVKHRVENRVSIKKLDILNELPQALGKVDLLVSNPPYIPSGDIENLIPSVSCFEPIIALDGGNDGLVFYRRLANISKVLLTDQGIIAVECGYNQAHQVENIFKEKGMKTVVIKDLSGIDRVVAAQR